MDQTFVGFMHFYLLFNLYTIHVNKYFLHTILDILQLLVTQGFRIL